MKNISAFLYFLLISSSSTAQWEKIEEIKYPYVYTVLFDGDNIYAGADSVYISRDRGLTWESKPIINSTVVTALFKADNRIFAGTYGDGIYQSTNIGESWQPFSRGLSSYAMYANDFEISGDTLIYGTDGGGVYILKLDSNTWQPYNQNLPSNYAWTVNDIAVAGTNIILSSGASGFYYIRSRGSGEWIEKTIATPGGIRFTPKVLFTMGDTVFAGSRWGIYRSIDNGSTWDSVGVKAMPIDVVAFAKDGKRIYAGFSRTSGNDFFIWYTDDYGNIWNSLDHQFMYLYNLYIYNDKIWAATNDGLWFDELTPASVKPVNRPSVFKLHQNYPNPFNPVTTIQYSVGSFQFVTLKIYDLLGNEVAVLVNEMKSPGTYNAEFNANEKASGVYLYILRAGEFSESKKMILLK